jgi:Tol biopolymer transport system component
LSARGRLRVRVRRGTALLAALGAALACRDATPPFEAQDHDPFEGPPPWRLTYNPGDDRAPAWSPDGEAVFYEAAGYAPFPRSDFVMVAAPREGGHATLLVPRAQVLPDTVLPLRTPVPSPDGRRVAFVEMGPTAGLSLCGGVPVCPLTGPVTEPVVWLRWAVLRVRDLDDSQPLENDPVLRIEFAGPVFHLREEPQRIEAPYYPGQRAFNESKTALFRPSWSPDGRRIVFSDGLRLWIWTVGGGEPVAVPGVMDAVSPAWSPDGEWIAFTHLLRGEAVTQSCREVAPGTGETGCILERTDYPLLGRNVAIVRPDGSGLATVGEGEEPAWSPDGSRLYFRRGDRIWRSGLDGSGAAPLPRTEGGREPAVSPDGRLLAFARRLGPEDAQAKYDIWVLPLDP